MNHLSMLLLSALAFACLALAKERHQEDVFGRMLRSDRTKKLRIAGWAMLLSSLVVALRQPLWSMALVAWFGWLSVGAGAVFAALMVVSREKP